MKVRQLFQAENRSAIEDWCRKQTQQCYLGDHTALARVLGNFLMYVDTRDQSLAPHLLMNGFWEMWVTQAIVDYVKPGVNCIDVGANVGYYTLLLAELTGSTGHVVAYEPQEQVCANLQRSIRVSGLNAEARQLAASNQLNEQAALYSSLELQGSSSLKRAAGLSYDTRVCTVRLDAEPMPGRIDFVKIDAQGHELEVLDGMSGIIHRSPKIAIVMEFTPSEHSDPRAALEGIRDSGLSIRTIGTDGQVRPILIEEAVAPDTGDHRMLWLSKG